MQPFLQDSQNLDLVGLILEQLLDSTEGHSFTSVEVARERTDRAGVVHKYTAHDFAGGIFEGSRHDYNKCTQVVVSSLSLVCRRWDEIVVESVHGGAKEILPPRALRTLKYKARTVDMTPCFGTFLRDLEDKFGDLVLSGIPDEDGNNEEMPFLPELYDYKFGSKEGFVKTVASAYSHFIVIKALETLAQDRISGPLVSPPAVTTSEFAERCQPTQILDLMWHAHILSPRAYAASGLSLIGTIIDHDPGYYNLNETEHASKLMPKVQKVFKYETRHLLNNYDDAGWVCLVNNSLADFACDINESLHDPGCG